MKRILSIILIFVLAISFVSCGNKGEKAASAGNRQESGLENVSENKEDKAPGNETGGTDKTDGTGEKNETIEAGETGSTQVEPGKIKESDLSDKYRTDLVPIFKGGVIVRTAEDPDHKVVGLICYSKKSYKEVKKYYKEIMSKYEILEEEEEKGDRWDPPSYYMSAKIGAKAQAIVNVIDVTRAPDDYFRGSESELPKNAKTVFALQYFNFEE